jgi:hypothetical protein
MQMMLNAMMTAKTTKTVTPKRQIYGRYSALLVAFACLAQLILQTGDASQHASYGRR